MILKKEEKSYKNILIKFLMSNKFSTVNPSDILYNNQRKKLKKKKISKPWEKRTADEIIK